MNNYKVIIEYDGTNYHGFAKQELKPTIQETLEECLSKILKENININGSGRTDAKVHALGQVINFNTDREISEYGLIKALNSNLPSDIVAVNVEKVNEKFHARFSAKRKTYMYIINYKKMCAFSRNYECFCKYKLDIEKMKSAIKLFEGKHDFKSYMSTGSAIRDTVRTIFTTNIYEKNDRVYIEFTGDGFLYNQVRIMVGTLIEIGRGKIENDIILKSFKEYNRNQLGKTASPQGLYLKNVEY